MVKAIAMGADGVVIGTAEMVAVGCIRCGCCESGRGCPRGIATTDPELLEMVTVEWCTQRLVNLYNAWRAALVDILYRLGIESVAALRGRTDVLSHFDYEAGSIDGFKPTREGAARSPSKIGFDESHWREC